MRELPALFRTEMVRAILEDRKWKTRRVIKPQPTQSRIHPSYIRWWVRGKGTLPQMIPPELIQYAPWQKGDHLWVRETHSIKSIGGARTDFVYYKATPDCGRWLNRSNEWVEEKPLNKFHTLPNKWSSPLFMPKWAARLWLEVLDVRAERLQNISYEDLVAEGIRTDYAPPADYTDLKGKFRGVWDTIYKKKPEFQWQANPWVWVYEFKRLDQSQP